MERTRFLAALLPLLVVACGGSGGSEQGGGAGGSSTAGGAGGSSPMGGSGNGGSAGAAVNAKPMGTVQSCFGPKCPMEACDNDKFWADVACSDVYSGPVGDQSSFCAADGSGNYCLSVSPPNGPGFGVDFAITCAAGVATIEQCKSGCGFFGNQPVQCN